MEGEYPPKIQRFKEAVKDILIEMKIYGGKHIQFEFIDPSDNPELMQSFVDKGITPITLNIRKSTTSEGRQYLFPVAVLNYEGREEVVDLFRGAVDYASGEPSPLRAEQQLEYKFIHALRRLTQGSKKIVGILKGHQETPNNYIQELSHDLSNLYIPIEVETHTGESISPSVAVLCIFQPDTAFSERDKYEIDQYLMRGGKILWLLDQEEVNLHYAAEGMTRLRNLNLDDLFMRYGFKINYDLIQDLNCSTMELVIPNPNAPPTFTAQPWIYYPLITALAEHPITRNLEAIKLRYVSSIDTYSRPNIRHIPLMLTSRYSRSLPGQLFVDLNQAIRQPPPPEALNGKGRKLVGTLIEGRFESLFQNRDIPVDAIAQEPPTARFLPRNVQDTRMIVVGDGQVAIGEDVRGKVDFMAYDNKTFILNAIDYLLGGESLINIRAKDLQYRALDLQKVKGKENLIRILNLGAPLLLLILFGWSRAWRRGIVNKKYKRPNINS
jgi:gliding-associated putative ABC transporter substrate-binding component GldG